MQPLTKPKNGCVLCSLHSLPLYHVRAEIWVAPDCKPMLQTRVILVVVRKPQFGNRFLTERFHLWRKHLVDLRSIDLYRYVDVQDFFLGEERWMADSYAIDIIVALCAYAEGAPTTEAETHRTHAQVLVLQSFGKLNDLFGPCVLGVAL